VLHAVYQYVKNAEQLPKPWLGVGKVQVVQFGCITLLEYAQKRENPIVDRVLLLSPLVRPAKTAWWHNSIGLGIIRRIKRSSSSL
jgi:hypothetical protein